MVGDEHLVGHERVRAGPLHARHEPGVLDRQLGHRDERERVLGDLARLVLVEHADEAPRRVQRP